MNWKRIFAALGAILVVTGVSAQEKLFKAAMKEGRKADAFYEVENPNYRFTVSEFESVASKNDCILEYTTTEVKRFGDVSQVVERARFLPRPELPDYICACLGRPWSGGGLATKTQKGAGWMWYFPDKQARKESYFFRYDNVFWSGETVEGMIHGSGEGFAMNDRWMVAFKGRFHKGYPAEKVTFRWIGVKDSSDGFHIDKVVEMTANCGPFHDDMAWFEARGKYGFMDAAKQTLLPPQYGEVINNFKDNYTGTNYAVIRHTDGLEWKMNRNGEVYAYSDAQMLKFEAAKAEAREAERKAEEQRRLVAEKRKAERLADDRLAAQKLVQTEENRRQYLAAVKANMDKKCWQRGDRICLEFFNLGEYITGTLEEWNADKSKCRIKIVTSPGARLQYNGENLEKNTTMWIATSGEGWHKALPEELEAASKKDNSTYVARTQLRIPKQCPICKGKGWRTEQVKHSGWMGSYTSTETKKCYNCDGTGWVEETQTLTF